MVTSGVTSRGDGPAGRIEITLHWHDGDPAFVATPTDDGLHLVVDPRLSDAQVGHACDQLGEWGSAAHAAWRQALGITPERP